ncbi:MAG: thioredoxin family protein [Legionella sp.]|nr:thioredoxin family protein [Legionella sp.]
MSKTESKMVKLGTLAPNFKLVDVKTGQLIQLDDKKTPIATVLFFICNHCPFVKHIMPKLIEVARKYLTKDIRFIAINSNDVIRYPDDSPENMRLAALNQNYPFPYIYDETQEVAKAYDAACTPDFFIVDKQLALVYRGQFDDSRPGNQIEVTGDFLSQALDCLLEDKSITVKQKPSMGCNIKWK